MMGEREKRVTIVGFEDDVGDGPGEGDDQDGGTSEFNQNRIRGASILQKPDVFKRKKLSYNYAFDLATSKTRTAFKMIFNWRGSLWKAIYKECIFWLLGYTIISVSYRYLMDAAQKNTFERLGEYCDSRMKYLPLNFVLGFFCDIVIRRWFTLFTELGTIDNIALFVSANISGATQESRQMKRNIVRYCVLSQTLVFRDIHVAVRRRFPTMEAVAEAGIMLPHELDWFNSVKSRYSKYWLSFNWVMDLLAKARVDGLITNDTSRNAIAQEVSRFRASLSTVALYDWVPIPLMYPQLVNMAVHVFFAICLIGRQFFISDDAHNKTVIDLAVPFMTLIEFVFYMGWLKVAMELLNPFGEDAADFDLNLLIDRNLTIGLNSVDDEVSQPPDVLPDAFVGKQVKVLDSDDSIRGRYHVYMGSSARMEEITQEVLKQKEAKREQDMAGTASIQGGGKFKRLTDYVSSFFGGNKDASSDSTRRRIDPSIGSSANSEATLRF